MAHYQFQVDEEGVNTGSDQLLNSSQLSEPVPDTLYQQQQLQFQQQPHPGLLPDEALNTFFGAFGQWPQGIAIEASSDFNLSIPQQDSSFQQQEEVQQQEQVPQPEEVPPLSSVEDPSAMAAISSAAVSPGASHGQPSTSMPVDSPGLLTQQWTVPPRPKPGRKPADDSPISKRKAQNRQAQRNFRERKAKKVDELEIEIGRMKQEFNFSRTALLQQHECDRLAKEKELKELHERLDNMKDELAKKTEEAKKFQKQISDAQRQAAERENMIQAMNHQRLDSVGSVATTSSRWGSSMQNTDTPRSSISLTSPTTLQRAGGYILTLPEPSINRTDSSICGRCGSGPGVCECVEKRLSRLPDPNHPNTLQPITPTEQKSIKSSLPMQQPTPGDEMEIDFTASYARPKLERSTTQSQLATTIINTDSTAPIDPGRPADHCGFCTNDTNCVCREAAAAGEESSGDLADDESSTGRALTSRSQSLRPQPMEPKVFLTEPGNCPSCRADPAKANFCRSLAAMRTPSILQPGPTPSFPNIGSSVNNYISCSDAFDKLREDPAFATASESQRQGMMRQLNQRQRNSEQGRTPLEVENASLLLSLSNGDSPPMC